MSLTIHSHHPLLSPVHTQNLSHFRYNKQKPSDHSSASSCTDPASAAVAAATSLIVVTFVLAFVLGHRRSSCAQMNLQHSLRLSNKDLLSSRTDRSHQPLHRPTEDPPNRSNDRAIDLPPQLDREIELDSYSHPCVILYNTHFSLESKSETDREREREIPLTQQECCRSVSVRSAVEPDLSSTSCPTQQAESLSPTCS